MKKSEDFENWNDYITYLRDNSLIYKGCYYCLKMYYDCGDKAIELKAASVPTVCCDPFGKAVPPYEELPEPLDFPKECVREWIGRATMYCPNCKKLCSDAYGWTYDDNFTHVCCSCGELVENI